MPIQIRAPRPTNDVGVSDCGEHGGELCMDKPVRHSSMCKRCKRSATAAPDIVGVEVPCSCTSQRNPVYQAHLWGVLQARGLKTHSNVGQEERIERGGLCELDLVEVKSRAYGTMCGIAEGAGSQWLPSMSGMASPSRKRLERTEVQRGLVVSR